MTVHRCLPVGAIFEAIITDLLTLNVALDIGETPIIESEGMRLKHDISRLQEHKELLSQCISIDDYSSIINDSTRATKYMTIHNHRDSIENIEDIKRIVEGPLYERYSQKAPTADEIIERLRKRMEEEGE